MRYVMYICNALKLIFLWNLSQYKKRLMTIIKTCVPAEIMTAAKKRSRAEVQQGNYIHNCQTEDHQYLVATACCRHDKLCRFQF